MLESSATIVKAAMSLADVSQTEIARECRVGPNAVNAVVHGRSRSKTIENRIAVVTGVPRERLWPQWYGPDAKRRRKRMTPAAMAAALEQLANLAEAS